MWINVGPIPWLTLDGVMGPGSERAAKAAVSRWDDETGSRLLRVGPKHRSSGRQPMQYDAGIDVSLEQSSVCVVDAAGKIVKEAKVATDPHVLVTFFKGLGFPVTRIGLEAGPCRIGCTRVSRKPDSSWCFWRPATSRQRCQRWWSRPTARMRVGLRSSSVWAGSEQCMQNRRARKRFERY